MDWHKIFDYRDGNLVWLVSPSKRAKVGDTAGTVNNRGYVSIIFQGKSYRAHRIVWEMHNGKIEDGYQIDHINHVRDDNRIENLRLVTNSINSKNKSKSSRGIGFLGVTWHSRDKVYQVNATVNGKRVHIGNFKCLNEAILARKLAVAEDAEYHDNHGKTVELM